MILHYRHYPASRREAAPLMILHGLYGHQGNWAPQAGLLAERFEVYALDARNHGRSPHDDEMSLAAMAQDVGDTMADLGLDRAHLLGHSMGGKTAMLFALRAPEKVASLLVVDIAPVAYAKGDVKVLEALQSLDLAGIETRADAGRQLARTIQSSSVRDFLLTNLQRDAAGKFHWRFNLEAIGRHFDDLIGWPAPGAQYPGPVLIIRGEASDYVQESHREAVLGQFPAAKLLTVAGAGHWVHSEKPETFSKLALRFFDRTFSLKPPN